MTVKKGDKVKVEYTGTLEDGTVFDSSSNAGKPIEFKAGEGQVIPGFDEAVIGMQSGEEKKVSLPPKKAYGDRDKGMLRTIPKEKLPAEGVKEGMMLVMSLPNGQQLPVQVVEVKESEAVLDLNHPLAGKTLNFTIKVVGVSE